MKLTVLGSGAAEAIPDPYCRCEVCQTARRDGGRHIRARSAALFNDDVLVDLGPDVISAASQFRLYLGNLSTILITHNHLDHWLPQNLMWREFGFTPTPVVPLTIYGPADVVQGFESDLEKATDLAYRPVTGGDQWTVGPYRMTAVPATHGDGKIEALLYVVDDGAHRVFYATDTSSLSEEAWDILHPLGPFDLILLDATSGLRSGGNAHHGFEQFVETRARMIAEGLLIHTKTTLVAHHFSHNGGLTHTALVDKYTPYDVRVSYDGLVFSL